MGTGRDVDRLIARTLAAFNFDAAEKVSEVLGLGLNRSQLIDSALAALGGLLDWEGDKFEYCYSGYFKASYSGTGTVDLEFIPLDCTA